MLLRIPWLHYAGTILAQVAYYGGASQSCGYCYWLVCLEYILLVMVIQGVLWITGTVLFLGRSYIGVIAVDYEQSKTGW